jgi:hypothetical protein
MLPRDTIHFTIEYFDGLEEGDIGTPYYVATAREIVAVTDAPSLDELMINIRDMLELYLDEPDTIAMYNIMPNPRVVVTEVLRSICHQTKLTMSFMGN